MPAAVHSNIKRVLWV